MIQVRWPVVIAIVAVSCTGTTITVPPPPEPPVEATVAAPPTPAVVTTHPPSTTDAGSTTTTMPPALPAQVSHRPSWLGTRPLPRDANGVPMTLPTPPELQDRRFVTVDRLPPPDGEGFRFTVAPVPDEVAGRSTWREGCPVALDDLAYVTVSFRGFDGRAHTGELLVADEVAADVVEVFRTLYEADFPIEEMTITSHADLEAEPTGDGNITASFVCRPVVGGSSWSQHAYGLAIDINPFHNPYRKGDRVIPELAGAYLDRDRRLPGMVVEGDVVTRGFDAIGWGWGGRWSSLEDYHHFSANGR